MKKIIPFCLLTLVSVSAIAQDPEPDSLQTLSEVTVRAFEQHRPAHATTAPVRLINSLNSDRYNKSSLVNSFNSIAGVRMEERSPGSYRLNIRGSSLRSPFGVRNIKVYWNDIPVTDAGGNTYFNQFAWNNFSSIEIFKGPASSLYGAGTGGLLLLNNLDRFQRGASVEYVTGSYGLQNIFASARFGQNENRNQLTFAHNQSDGYRDQTEMKRDNFSWASQVKISDRQQLTASLLYTDLYYQTPGALTLAEYTANPKAARPAGAGFPSAIDAKAAIRQKTILAGFSNQYHFSPSFKNTTTLYGSYAQVKNSAIRNYERRTEPQFGGRSVFVYQKNNLQLVGGMEFQQGFFNTQVSRNLGGNPDTLQTNDDIRNGNWSAFTQADLTVAENWYFTAGVSVTRANVSISRLNNYPVIKQSRHYDNEIAPRLAVARKITEGISVIASVSRGFSPPTTAEVLPSTGVISTELEAEDGWNYEMTLRYALLKNKLNFEATGFYFKLNNALVQRRDISGADFFVNAGDVKQRGLELHGDYTYANVNNLLFDHILLQADYTWNHFRYGNFVKGNDDFSGKTVPSVPSSALSILANLQLRMGIYSQITYYSASSIYLNDANTAKADAYQLLGCRIGWKKQVSGFIRMSFYAGIDNLLDVKYSLGNDINAAANRFYNAAPRRNYYAGVNLQWISPTK